MERPRILFVCGRNQWRSPTAERMYRNDPRIEVRSAGVSQSSKKRIARNDVEWADLILVMERRYGAKIREQFRGGDLPPIESLEIPDEFEFMDAELVELLKESVETQLCKYQD